MGPARYLRLVRGNRNFRLLWTAQIVSELGDWLYTVAVYSLLLEYTGSAKSLGIAFVLQVLPQFFMAAPAGVINDRLSRKKVMLFADWTRAGVVLCMALVRGPGMVWLMYGLLFTETILWGLFEPGRNAVLPNIVGEGELVAANTIGSITWSFNFASGAALGGVLAAYLGRDVVFGLNSLSFIASALLLRRMKFAEPHAEARGKVRAAELWSIGPVVEGMRYVKGNRRLRSALFLKSGLGLLGANWVIVPVLGERVFALHRPGFGAAQAGMLGMSALMTARGIGALIGPLAAGGFVGESEKRLRWAVETGFAMALAGYLALSRAPVLAVAAGALILAHGGLSAVWVFSTTLLQLRTEDRFRGRVFAAEMGVAVVTMAASSYGAGWLVDAGVPVERVAALAGLTMIVPLAWWGWAQRFWGRGEGGGE